MTQVVRNLSLLLVLSLLTGFVFAQAPTIQRNLAVVIVDFTDLQNIVTHQEIQSNLVKSNSILNKYTYGAVQLNYDVDGNGQADIYGPFSIRVSSADTSTSLVITETGKLDRKFPISNYQHVIYILPSGARYSAWAHTGSYTGSSVTRGWITDQANDSLGFTFIHELYHTLGLTHANSVATGEYGDYSSIMGQSFYRLNAPQAGYFGAFARMGSQYRNIVEPTDEIITLHSFDIDPAQVPAGAMKVIQVKRDFNTTSPYTLSYRSIENFPDGQLMTGKGYVLGVNIHSGVSGSLHHANLSDTNNVFHDQTNRITITQISRTVDSVTFRLVKEDVPVVAPLTPTLNLFYKSETASNGFYSISLSSGVNNVGTPVVQYKVYKKINQGSYNLVSTQNISGPTPLSFQDLVPGAEIYSYYIEAVGDNGIASQASNIITVDYSSYPAGGSGGGKGKNR